MGEDTFDIQFHQVMGGEGASLHTALVEGRFRDFLEQHDPAIKRLYQKNLESSHEPEAPVISFSVLPPEEEETRRRQFEMKIKEYGDRLVGKVSAWAPLINPGQLKSILHTLYKRDGMVLLLGEGSLNTFAYSRAMSEYFGGAKLSLREFNDACGVIEDYMETGGKEVEGGTGLAKV